MKVDPDTIIAEKILYILDHVPRVSPSMLQISLGSGIPTAIWHPVLERLIEDETIYRCQKPVRSPAGRIETKTIISLEPVTDSDGDEEV